MAIKEIIEPILQGEPQTYSKIVETEAVKKGMLLMKSSKGKVKPATAAAKIVGVAMMDAAIGEEVTFAIPGTDFIARLILAESQTIVEGDSIVAAVTTIAGVANNGEAGKMADVTFTAGGATGPEVSALVTQMRSFVGYSMEEISTGADETKAIKVRVKGAAI